MLFSARHVVFALSFVALVLSPRVVSDPAEPTDPRVALRKYQPAFPRGTEARLLADCRNVTKPEQYFAQVWLSAQAQLDREGELLLVRPLIDLFGADGFGERVPFSVPIPQGLSPGTYYVTFGLSRSRHWRPKSLSARWSTKIVVVDESFDRLDAELLRQQLKPTFVDRGEALRINMIRQTSHESATRTLSILFPPGQPGGVQDVSGAAANFLATGRYPLSEEVAVYQPGPAFWLAERKGPDMLEIHALRILRILMEEYGRTQNRELLTRAIAYVDDWRQVSEIAAYHSPFVWQEHAVPERLVSLLMLIHALPDEREFDDVYAKLLTDIGRHARLLAADGFYASWSNHGMYQMEALLAAATTFDCFAEAASWRAIALQRAGEFLEKKFHADGGLDEGTASYSFIVLDKLLRIEAMRRISEPAVKLPKRLENACEFAIHTVKPNGPLWGFGESFTRSPRFVYTRDLPPALRLPLE
ncbi:MAG: heparinase II/III family protein, partial [Phycisphaerae bacterium]